MDISELVVMLTFLCIPGIIFIFLEQKALYRSEKSDMTLILKAIVFGFISYFVLGMIYMCLNNCSFFKNHWNINLEVNFFKFLENLGNTYKNQFIDVYEIVWASCIAFILSCIKISISNTLSEIRTFSNNFKKGSLDEGEARNTNKIKKFMLGAGLIPKKLIVKSFEICKSLNLVGGQIANDSDVWNYILTNNKAVVLITDESIKKTYFGRLVYTGNKNGIREVYLENVCITNLKNNVIEMVESYYLSRPVGFSWNIEFFPIKQGDLTKEKIQELMQNRRVALEKRKITRVKKNNEKSKNVKFKRVRKILEKEYNIIENIQMQMIEIKEKKYNIMRKEFEDKIKNWLKKLLEK